MRVHVLQKAVPPQDEEMTLTEARKKMPPCPICGMKAFLSHDIVDGFDFGFMGGCPAFCLNDSVHGITDIDDPRSPRVSGYSAKQVCDGWVEYCKKMDGGDADAD